MKKAVIETGGKQYLVSPGQILKIEKIKNIKEGENLVFDKVLLVADDNGKVEIGQPYVKGAKINAQVLKIGRSKKIIVFHYHNKTRYRKKAGHRQPYLQIKIADII